MRVLGEEILQKAVKKHPELMNPLATWVDVARASTWKKFDDVRKTFGSADYVASKVVFNIKGNNFRLIATINFSLATVFVEHVLTHAAYSKGNWK